MPFTVAPTLSRSVGSVLLIISPLSHGRVVLAREVPLMATQVLGASAGRKLAAFTTFSVLTAGAACRLPNNPCGPPSGPGRPAVKYMALASPPLPPLPNCNAQRPGTTIG